GTGILPHAADVNEAKDEVERRIILEALDRNARKVSHAAEELGIHRATLYRKMQRLGIES
ncbi:MAG: helix-turn-helix domain-containing protein, partial [Sphaerochaetaceae bacterium]|nr:helix-turn-helix domain-containing protein [Sphaerochaetaceae bacterium]